MSGRRVLGAGLIATLLLAPALDAAAGGFDPVLWRLRKLSRGDFSYRRPGPASVPFGDEIRRAARRNGVPPSLLAALVRAESNFDRRAVSWRGARGLGQLMPLTAHELGVSDPFDARQNLDGSARYLARQIDRFRDVGLALAAYHAGPERVADARRALPDTTRRYVARVLRFDREYRARGLP